MIRQALLTLMLALMIGGFLLIWDSPPESFIRQPLNQLEQNPQADSYMTAVTSRRFSDQGNEQFSLSSPRIEFFEGESTLTLEQPQFLSQGVIRQPLQLSAKIGRLDSANGKLDLYGNVRADITSDEGVAQLTTERLTYLIDNSIATTDEPFSLLTAQSIVSGTGLKLDLVNETFTIQSKVRVTHDPI